MPQLNSIQRAQVIAHIQDGIPIRDVAHIMNTSKNTVQKIKRRWEIEGTLEKKKPTGRPRISTHKENDEI